MADISRNTTPAWQDPHLKDRGDYTEQDIQNIQEKGGILPDFTLDEAEETHLFARVAQALSKTLTRQGLAVRHEAKARPPNPWATGSTNTPSRSTPAAHGRTSRSTSAHALGAIQVARDALNPGGPAARSRGMEQVQGQGPHGGRPAARLHRTPQLPLA